MARTSGGDPQPALADAAPDPASTARDTGPAGHEWSFVASRQFTDWLGEHNLSLAVTTYQASKLLLIGRTPDARLTILQRSFSRPMGLWTNGQTLLLSALYQILRFENTVPPGQSRNGFDRMFVPKMAYFTGDLDVHDIAVGQGGRILFVNTLFGCLSTVNPQFSFEPVWQPSFLSKLAAEDRCHLNGLAMAGGQPGFVTAISEADVAGGWRDHRQRGGVVVDVQTDAVVARGLSMPHSPRLYRGRLWLLNSGTGEFGFVDPGTGAFTALTFCPGYARGLAFHGDFALVGLSRPRDRGFGGLKLQETLAAKKASPRCGVMVIDLRTGDIVHWITFEGAVGELYDVAVLPGVRRPAALGFETDEIRRAITVAPHRPAG